MHSSQSRLTQIIRPIGIGGVEATLQFQEGGVPQGGEGIPREGMVGGMEEVDEGTEGEEVGMGVDMVVGGMTGDTIEDMTEGMGEEVEDMEDAGKASSQYS